MPEEVFQNKGQAILSLYQATHILNLRF